MGFLQTLLVALRALGRNKLRSFLTALGIIIGIGAVILVVSIGEGAKAQVADQFSAMGSNLLIVMSGSTKSGGSHGGWGSMPTLTNDDLAAIRELSAVRYAAPLAGTTSTVVSDEQNWTTRINGTTPEYFPLRNWRAASGRLFTDAERESGAKVVDLGQTVVEKLFGPGTDAVGQVVRIKNVPYQVIGLLASKGQSPMGQDNDDIVLMPNTTFRQKVRSIGLAKFVDGIVFVAADSPEGSLRAEAEISALLRDRHHLADGADDDFQIRNLTEMADAMQQGQQTIAMLLTCIAVVSLVVGGIGVMNIMLVSVTERTREIGLRMAIGATPWQILLQFLVESSALACVGGMIGVATGIGGSIAVARGFGWATLVRYDIVLVAVGVSAAVGVVFGLYPAWKASRLDPIVALRFE